MKSVSIITALFLIIPAVLIIAYLSADTFSLSQTTESEDRRLGKQVLIPEGDYYAGSDQKEDEQPLRMMHFKSFSIDIHPVTNKQYAAFLMKSNYITEGPFNRNDAIKNPYFPAGNIIYKDASAYAKYYQMRLPTEWEWEIAARSLKKENIHAWGDKIGTAVCNSLINIENLFGMTPVFNYPPNELGLYDMAGNAFEWTSSLYPTRFMLGNNYSNYTLLVIRGGAWNSLINDITVSARSPFPSNRHLPWLGFRCVKDAP